LRTAIGKGCFDRMTEETAKTERYQNLDGLRAFACLGILAMHLNVLGAYSLGKTVGTVINAGNELVPLFLMLSGFGMFCGYYERFRNGSVNYNGFYAKRYRRILPFFALMILIDVIAEHSAAHLIQGLAELTLAFGLLPNNQLDCIGVGWTLGVIFLFYMLFPFFVFLCWSKRRAWISCCIAIALSLLCSAYFFTERFVVSGFINRQTFLYCAPFFTAGGNIFLHKDMVRQIVSRHKFVCLAVCLAATVLWFFLPVQAGPVDLLLLKNLFVSALWLCYAVGCESRLLSSRPVAYLGSISLEIYLAQMLTIRLLQRSGVLKTLGDGWLGYLLAYLVAVLILITGIAIYRRCAKMCAAWLEKKRS